MPDLLDLGASTISARLTHVHLIHTPGVTNVATGSAADKFSLRRRFNIMVNSISTSIGK